MARKLEKNDDVVVVQPSSAAIVGAGPGDDIYILSPHVIGAGKAREFAISDSEGKNVLQLVEGLTISSSKVAGEFLALYLSDGSSIMMGGAPDFTFEVGGNILAGVEGEKQNYTTFVTQTLGTTVPAEGAISEGVANIVIGAGTPPPQPTPTPTPTPTPQPDPTPTPQPDPIPEPAPDPLPGATLINGTEKDDKFDLNTVNWKGTPGKAIIKPVGGNDSIVGLSDVANELIIDGPFDGLTITGGSAGDKVTILEPLTKDMMFTSIDLGGGTDTVVLHKVESMAVLKDAVSKIAGVENLVVNKANLTVSMEGLKELLTMSKENLILGEHVKLTIDGTNESDYFDLRDLVWDGAPGEVVINLGGGYNNVKGMFGKLSLLGTPRAENKVDFYASAEDLVFLGGPKYDWIEFYNPFEGNLSIDLGEGKERDGVWFHHVTDGDLFKAQVANITNVERVVVYNGTPKISVNDLARFSSVEISDGVTLTIDGTEQADTIDLTKIGGLDYESRAVILNNFTSGSDKIVYQGYYPMRDKTGKELKGIEGALVDATCDFSANMDAITKKQAVFNVSGTGDVAQGDGTDAEAVLEKIFGNSTSVARTTGYDEIKNAKFVFAVDDGQDTFLWRFSDRINDLPGKADVKDLILLGTITGVTELAPADIDLA